MTQTPTSNLNKITWYPPKTFVPMTCPWFQNHFTVCICGWMKNGGVNRKRGWGGTSLCTWYSAQWNPRQGAAPLSSLDIIKHVNCQMLHQPVTLGDLNPESPEQWTVFNLFCFIYYYRHIFLKKTLNNTGQKQFLIVEWFTAWSVIVCVSKH